MDESTTGPVNPEGPPEGEPTVAGPAADEPPVAEPAAEEPTVAEPAASEPVAAVPAAEEPAAIAPTAAESAVPTIATGGGGTKISGNTILIGIVAIVIIAVAVWFFAFRGSGIGDKFVGTWVPIDLSNGGGGMVISKSGSVFNVAIFNDTGGTDVTLTGKLKGDTLELTLPADLAAIAGNVTITATHVKQTDHLLVKVVGGGNDQTTEFKRAASIPITNPSSMPSAYPSSMPSATPYSSGSPDNAVKEGIHSIQVGIQSWAVNNGDVFPTNFEVRQNGAVGGYVDNWPTNPYTGQPMTSGSGPGDFTYTLATDSTSYTLSGHMSTGDFTVP